jgi:type I restriction enzyme S subunit
MNNDWIEVELGEVCEINMGQSPPSSSYNYDRNGLPFFQGKAEFTELYPEVKKWCDTPKKVASINDILISVRAPVGATNLANQVCAIGRGLAAISYPKCYKYIFYYLRFIEQLLDAKGTGSTFKAISGSILRSQTIPLAPLPEQRAIVAKIEQLFSELDNGIQNLKTAQRKLTLYRQAVLKKAFEGGFTEQWRKEQGIESDGSLHLAEICKHISDGDHQAPPKSSKGVPFITISNVNKANLKIDFSNTYYVGEDYYSNLKDTRKPAKGDVLYTVTGSFGIPIVVDFDKQFCFQRHIGLLRPLQQTNQQYLFYLLQSPQVYLQAKNTSTGTAQKTVSLKSLRNFTIPSFQESEQHQIVQEIESRLSVCDKVQEAITQNLQKAEALRQSILKKAFAGNLLTEKELTACRNEPDYAPASELLKEIVN